MRKVLLAILLSSLLFTACSKDDNNTSANDKDTAAYFNANLRADMKYDEMVNLFGAPDGDLGSGIHIYYYDLNDGTRIVIGYADKIMYARHVSTSGQVLHNII
jgi:hypothetical protein